jgi:elongation factor P hydroxylase
MCVKNRRKLSEAGHWGEHDVRRGEQQEEGETCITKRQQKW